jgi:hypothetical protein
MREEAILLASPAVQEFLNAVRIEHRSYPSRCVPGESICRELDGQPFDWGDKDHNLVWARGLAQEIVNDPAESHEECAASLETYLNGASRGVYVDPVAGQTIDRMLEAFAPEGFTFWRWSVLRLTDYLGWKTNTGAYVIRDRAEMSFEPAIETILDAAQAALSAAGMPHIR